MNEHDFIIDENNKIYNYSQLQIEWWSHIICALLSFPDEMNINTEIVFLEMMYDDGGDDDEVVVVEVIMQVWHMIILNYHIMAFIFK